MLDLFPETLLVQRNGERIYTTSLKVAEHFHKAHRNVVRSIERLLSELPSDAFNVLNFERVEYKDKKGERRFMYEMGEEGFALLAMGFTGKQALRWKLDFLAAFRQMRADLNAVQARYVAALDVVRPCLRPVAEDAAAGLPRKYTAWSLGKSVASVSYHRMRARHLGILPRGIA